VLAPVDRVEATVVVDNFLDARSIAPGRELTNPSLYPRLSPLMAILAC
jgi:hypothetical protein